MAADAERLAQLVEHFDGHPELNRTPLLYEMEEAAGPSLADEARAPDPKRRWVAARVMELLPDESHIDPLGRMARDDDARVARAARTALRGQPRSDTWYAVVEALAADASDPALAAAAAQWLCD